MELEEFWKIENGDYIRTKEGLIGTFEAYADNYYINGCNSNYFEHFIDRKDIKSYSKNIIDLIEVSDYVNGEYVEHIDTCLYGGEKAIITDLNKSIFDNMIRTIVTKEQFNRGEYRINE